MKRSFTDEQVINAVSNKNNITIKSVIDEIGVGSISGTTYTLIHDIVKKHNLDVSHWVGVKINKGKKLPRKWPISHYLKLFKVTIIHSHQLKIRLLEEGIKKHECEMCKNTLWNGKEISLELHHVNGNKNDNRLNNLQILCANCHAQTDNYSGKNKKLKRLADVV